MVLFIITPKPHGAAEIFAGQQKPEAILSPSFQPPDVSSLETILEPPHFEGGAAWRLDSQPSRGWALEDGHKNAVKNGVLTYNPRPPLINRLKRWVSLGAHNSTYV